MSNGEYTTEQLIDISNIYTNEIKDTKLKIVEIDKKFKKNNQKIISNAVSNVLGISLIVGMVLNSDKGIQNFGGNQVSALI